MGTVRVALALAVVVGHGRPWLGLSGPEPVLGLHPLHPYFAVQLFFVVSGFYMALVFDRKYGTADGGTRLFWLNRAARLLPAYWVVCIATLIGTQVLPNNRAFVVEALNGACRPAGSLYDVAMLGLLVFTNLTLVAQDLVEFFQFCGRPASGFLLVSQAWTVGMEVWFYLLTPLLVRLQPRALILLAVASFGVRIALSLSDLPFYPWQQRFMPAELMFFVLGILAYRTRDSWPRLRSHPTVTGGVALAILLVVSAGIGWIVTPPQPGILAATVLGLVMFALVPPVFGLTATWRFDRTIGDLSYPIYLWHIFVGVFVEPIHRDPSGLLYVGITLALAVLTVVAVEYPAERWRQRQSQRKSQRRLATTAAPAVGVAHQPVP